MAERKVIRDRTIAAEPSTIFDVLADPRMHPVIDGSGMLKGNLRAPRRLELGSRFGMRMKLLKLPYVIDNVVVEYERDRRIAWRHLFRHRWRYELEPLADGRTRVTETFDYGTAPSPYGLLLERLDVPRAHERSIERTLENLERVAVERQAELDGDITG